MDGYYLFLYDIHLPKALRTVVKILDGYNSMRLQKSVFEVQGDKDEIEELMSKISEAVDIKTDKVALVPLCEDDQRKIERYGVYSQVPQVLPDYLII